MLAKSAHTWLLMLLAARTHPFTILLATHARKTLQERKATTQRSTLSATRE